MAGLKMELERSRVSKLASSNGGAAYLVPQPALPIFSPVVEGTNG